MTTTNRLTKPARNGSATSGRPARPPSPARSPKPNRCLQRMKPPRGGRKVPASVFASVPTGTNQRTPLPPHLRRAVQASERKRQGSKKHLRWFFHSTAGQGRRASTPRRKEERRAARRCAAPARSLRRAGPLGRKAIASRPAQPGSACSQASGVDPPRRPAVPLITSDWLGEQRKTAS